MTGVDNLVLLAAASKKMFERDYGSRTIEPVVVCKEGDPALEWFADEWIQSRNSRT